MSTFNLWSAFVSSICWAVVAGFYWDTYLMVGGYANLFMVFVGAAIFLGQAAVFVLGIKDVNNANTSDAADNASRALHPGGGDDYRTLR